MQKLLDDVKLAEDDSLTQMKTHSIVKDSPFIYNGTIGIVGNIGSGKTSLIAKLLVIYHEHSTLAKSPKETSIDSSYLDTFYFFDGTIDSTMNENINKYNIKIVPILSEYMAGFISKYRAIKIMVIEVYKYLSRDDYWSETLTELKNELKTNTILPYAKRFIQKYMLPSELEVNGKKFSIQPLIDRDGNITPSLMVFDDITQFKGFTGKYANSFFKELAANTRHFMNTSIFSMQRFTFLQKDVRALVNTWSLGYGISEEDITSLYKQSVTVAGFSTKDLINLYDEIEQYEFMVINSALSLVTKLKVNK